MQAGQMIAGRYRLEEQIGSGGNGVVWRATDEQLDRLVALKRAIPGEPGQYAEQLQQLRREARLLARLNHRNIVTLYDVLDDGAECWLVMEYVPAQSMAARGVLPPVQVARLGAQIADALAAVHAKGILHRDVKPGNILMISDDEVKLGDFGISRILAGEETVTGSALLAGTPGYVAPEVANGSDPTAASDVFSLGSTLFAAVEGTSPVGGNTDNAFLRLRRAAEGHIAPCRVEGPLAPVLTQLLQVDPAKRPTAAQAHRMLAEVGDREVPAAPSRPRISFRCWGFVAAGAVVVVLGLVAWLAFRGSPGSLPRESPPSGFTMGEPRTVDPCKLVSDDMSAMNRFGSPNLVPDEFDFEQCDVIVKVDDNAKQSDVKIRLASTPPSDASPPQVENRGTFGIVRAQAGDGICQRRLLLPDHYEIQIDALRVSVVNADFCGMADVATASAAAVVATGKIPQRVNVDARSLVNVDACRAASSPKFPRLPGIDTANPRIGFGHWRCTWTSTVDSTTLLVEFGRRKPLSQSGGRPVQVAGQPAVIDDPSGEEPDSCEVEVANFDYTDGYGYPKIEALYAEATSKQKSRDERCDLALTLATASFPPR